MASALKLHIRIHSNESTVKQTSKIYKIMKAVAWNTEAKKSVTEKMSHTDPRKKCILSHWDLES